MSDNNSFDLINLSEKFETYSVQINHFSDKSESKFLEIGDQLQGYLNTSKNITKETTVIASSISDEVLKNGIDELSWLLTEFNNYLSSSKLVILNDKSELRNIQPHIAAIVDELDGFVKIVKQLRMLGIATKIESARLGTEDQGFNALAENVDKLSALISDKVGNIFKRSSFLLDELNNTILNLDELEKEQEEQSKIIIKNISLSLDAFKTKHDEQVEQTELISSNSKKVSGSINEIVTSIQFHDITRQQMQHVNAAFNENAQKLKSISNNPNIDLTVELGAIYDVCQLQSIQLRNSLDEFFSAVIKIIESLTLVDDGISQILTSVSQLFTSSENNRKSDLSSVIHEIDSIRKGLARNSEIGFRLSASINSVVSVVDDLSRYVLEIEEIGSEIEIIALNARVKAARTGSNGSALGVLSERIQKLSIDAKEQTSSTAKLLGKVSDETKNLSVNAEHCSYGNENQKLVDAINKIDGIVNGLIEREHEQINMIDKLRSNVDSLKNELVSTIDGIHVHEFARISIEPIIKEVEDVYMELGRYNIKSNKISNTKVMQSKYSMHSERKIHRGYTDGWNKKTEDNINNKNNPDSFGDNVELF